MDKHKENGILLVCDKVLNYFGEVDDMKKEIELYNDIYNRSSILFSQIIVMFVIECVGEPCLGMLYYSSTVYVGKSRKRPNGYSRRFVLNICSYLFKISPKYDKINTT